MTPAPSLHTPCVAVSASGLTGDTPPPRHSRVWRRQFAIRPRAQCSIEPHVKPRRLVASLFRRRNHSPQSKRCGVTCRSRPGHPRGLERGRSHQAPGQCIHAIVSSSVPGSLQAVRTFAHASSAVSRSGAVSESSSALLIGQLSHPYFACRMSNLYLHSIIQNCPPQSPIF